MKEARTGFTTGACAAAAAKAAALVFTGKAVSEVPLVLPDGAPVALPVDKAERLGSRRAWAKVVKQAGDDPDVTDGVAVCVDVEILDGAGSQSPQIQVEFVAGPGVGVVTRPGLQVPVGEPAINPVPRTMITDALEEVLGPVRCRVTVSVPKGEELASRTFNSRLGIVGGISILGTSGRVFPHSNKAWIVALLAQVGVALRSGHTTLYLAPGTFGEKAAATVLGAPKEAIVRCSNFVGLFLDACAERGAEAVVLVGHVGKLVKVAAGIFDTHSSHGDARLETVSALAAQAGAPASLVDRLLGLPTVEAAVELLAEAGLQDVWSQVAERAAQRARARAALAARLSDQAAPRVDCVLVDYRGSVLGASSGVRDQLKTLVQPEGSKPGPGGKSAHVLVVGMGPGDPLLLTPAAWRALREADVLAGGARHLEGLPFCGAERICLRGDMEAVAETIRTHLGRTVVIAASGDPTCYGIAATLRRSLPEAALEVVPGISSFQLALARLSLSWQEVAFCSVHGRGLAEVLSALVRSKRVLVMTDPKNSPQEVARGLLAKGITGSATVLERLSLPDERIVSGDLQAIAQGSFDACSVMLVEVSRSTATCLAPGLLDEAFVRGRVPMTKAEVRAVVLAKARLLPWSHVLDIGAGTGSITIETRRMCTEGRVVAVERDPVALSLLRANLEHFGLLDVEVIEGEAPDSIRGDERFDRVFVGGTGGRLPDILHALPRFLFPGGRVVFSCVCLQTVTELARTLQRRPWQEFDCVQIGVARAVRAGQRLRLSALNPVWVVSAMLSDFSGVCSAAPYGPALAKGDSCD